MWHPRSRSSDNCPPRTGPAHLLEAGFRLWAGSSWTIFPRLLIRPDIETLTLECSEDPEGRTRHFWARGQHLSQVIRESRPNRA